MPVVDLYTRERILTNVLSNDEITERMRRNKWFTFNAREIAETGRTKFDFVINYTSDDGVVDEVSLTTGLPLPAGFLRQFGDFVTDYLGEEVNRWNRVIEVSKVTKDFPKAARTLFESIVTKRYTAELIEENMREDKTVELPMVCWEGPWSEDIENGKTYNFPGLHGLVVFTIYKDNRVTLRIDDRFSAKETVSGYSPEAGLKLPRRYGNEEVELTAEEFIELHVAKNRPDLLCLGAGKLFAYYQLPMVF